MGLDPPDVGTDCAGKSQHFDIDKKFHRVCPKKDLKKTDKQRTNAL